MESESLVVCKLRDHNQESMASRSSASHSDGDKPPSREREGRKPPTADEIKMYKHASVGLGGDPRVQEMKHFVSSHQYTQRSQKRASLTLDGVSITERAHVIPKSIDGEENAGFLKSIFSRPARRHWREEMDKNTRMLLLDIDLAQDNLTLGERGHPLRCRHVDKMYGWFSKHARKDIAKEKKGPPFLKQDPDMPAMPGSLRDYRTPPTNSGQSAFGSRIAFGKPSLISSGMRILSKNKTGTFVTEL